MNYSIVLTPKVNKTLENTWRNSQVKMTYHQYLTNKYNAVVYYVGDPNHTIWTTKLIFQTEKEYNWFLLQL